MTRKLFRWAGRARHGDGHRRRRRSPPSSSDPGASRYCDSARYLGTVEAPGERAAEPAAIAQFELNQEQRRRLAVREQD
jgi:hypothetical protein